MVEVQIPVGGRPGWEATAEGDKLIVEQAEDDSDNSSDVDDTLQPISEARSFLLIIVRYSLVLLHSLRQSRRKWLRDPPFIKFSAGKDKNSPRIPQPQHILRYIGRCDLVIGPHIFLNTKAWQVLYSAERVHDPAPNSGATPRIGGNDVIIEFAEGDGERFILPLECAIIERERQINAILISTHTGEIIPSAQLQLQSMDLDGQPQGPIPKPIPRHPITLRLQRPDPEIWRAISERVVISKLNLPETQEALKEIVNHTPARVYLPLKLPDGPLIDDLYDAVNDGKFVLRPFGLKALKGTEPDSTITAATTMAAPKRRVSSISKAKLDFRGPIKNNHDPERRRSSAATITSASTASTVKLPAAGPTEYTTTSLDANGRPRDRMTRMKCKDCNKSIARKLRDVQAEGFVPLCRPCGAKVRQQEQLELLARQTQQRPPAPAVPLPAQPYRGPYPSTYSSSFYSPAPTTPYAARPRPEVVVPTYSGYSSYAYKPPAIKSGTGAPLPAHWTGSGSAYNYYPSKPAGASTSSSAAAVASNGLLSLMSSSPYASHPPAHNTYATPAPSSKTYITPSTPATTATASGYTSSLPTYRSPYATTAQALSSASPISTASSLPSYPASSSVPPYPSFLSSVTTGALSTPSKAPGSLFPSYSTSGSSTPSAMPTPSSYATYGRPSVTPGQNPRAPTASATPGAGPSTILLSAPPSFSPAPSTLPPTPNTRITLPPPPTQRYPSSYSYNPPSTAPIAPSYRGPTPNSASSLTNTSISADAPILPIGVLPPRPGLSSNVTGVAPNTHSAAAPAPQSQPQPAPSSKDVEMR